MNKNYILNREELKNVILGAKTYIAGVCRGMIERGEDPTKLTRAQTDKVIDEYIDSIPELKIDELLDTVDDVLFKTTGMSSREFREKKSNG